MKLATHPALVSHGQRFDGSGAPPVCAAAVLVVDSDVLADISVLENRDHLIAVRQGGVVKAGRVMKPASF